MKSTKYKKKLKEIKKEQKQIAKQKKKEEKLQAKQPKKQRVYNAAYADDKSFEAAAKIFPFETVSFQNWYKLAQYVINYDTIYANVEFYDELKLRLDKLNIFLDSKGIMPTDVLPIIKKFDEKMGRISKHKYDVNAHLHPSLRKDNWAIKKELEDIKKRLINKFIIDYDPTSINGLIKYIDNPYFIRGADQCYDIRYDNLLDERKVIINSLNKVKRQQKFYKRELEFYQEQFELIMGKRDYDFIELFTFARPYVSEIVNSYDCYYHRLVEIAIVNNEL